MHAAKDNASDIETTLGKLLRTGVLVAGGIVILGGTLNLLRHGNESVVWEKFHGEPTALRTLSGIAEAAYAGQGKGIIQLGLILLVALPVLRVLVSMVAFAQRKDFVFVGVTFIVLTVLVYSLLHVS